MLDGTAEALANNEDVKELYLGGHGAERKSFPEPEELQAEEAVALTHYDNLETRSADAREAALAEALRRQLAHAKAQAPHYARVLADIDPVAAPLAALPITRKSALIAQQSADPPFGGVVVTEPGMLARVFVSPGPIAEPEAAATDYWRYARALHATGLRRGELLHNCFAYHFTPAGSMLEGGARALGCPVFPAGTGNTEMQARAAAQLRPRCYSGTPDFLKAILEKADELGLDLSSLRLGHVTGGLSALSARLVRRSPTSRVAELRHSRYRPDCL
ncbi:phenylacetate--CoA ligase family protein [Dankookia sp. P2]|uniref:phenylacetate--CoA ligase family protein n=1 Tax=Dankookia sp. P2 TaxID=3423955 RepID=UPI003D67CDC5